MKTDQNQLTLKCIQDLLEMRFFIPDYQRGYRWTGTQVMALLEDIWEFRRQSQGGAPEVFYCLQPVVVAPKEDGSWVVIDGQQRLTTLHLILSVLGANLGRRAPKKFALSYQTRPCSEAFLNEPKKDQANDNPDFHHIFKAYSIIEEWFDSKGGNADINFMQTLLNSDEEGQNVRVIWYEVAPTETTSHIDIFTRLNIGKIPLTNAELIKAQLLNRNNFGSGREELSQIRIATEWDLIQNRLHRPDFWFFLYDPDRSPSYEDRIEYLFDLKYDWKREYQQHHTFLCFLKDFEDASVGREKPDVDTLWQEIKDYFLTFEDWYRDSKLYHFIGFLVAAGEDLKSLKQESQARNKTDFMDYLHGRIREKVNFNLVDLEYGSTKSNKKIKRALLLFNILTLTGNKGADMRFPFHHLKEVPWDIEHIRSQTDLVIKGEKQQRAWLLDILDYFTGLPKNIIDSDSAEEKVIEAVKEENKDLCLDLLKAYKKDKLENEEFLPLREAVETLFLERGSEEQEEYGTHSIGNLALLDEQTNRSYGNAPFPVKRKRIILNDGTGKFVPICTKNVFLKYYSNQFEEVMYWRPADARAHEEAILSTLENFLPQEN